MARIAFGWELGQGFGHLIPYLALIRRLTARGDEVFFLAKQKQRAQQVFNGLPVEVVELEPGFTLPAERIVDIDSYPEMLHNCGYHDANSLYDRVTDLAATIANIAPDVLIVDFAPTVMLANVGLGLPIIATGSGYQVPVRSTPMPRFRYWHGVAGDTLVQNESRVLDVVNQVLTRMGWSRLNSIAALLKADCEWLTTFAELDFYGARDGANYLGTFPVEGLGHAPRWPTNGDFRVFAYLAPGPAAMATLHALEELRANVCLYAPKFSAADEGELNPEMIHLTTALTDFQRAGREASLFVHNGNLNTTAAGLLVGKPQLAIPTTAERYLNARRLELLGAGLAARQDDLGNISVKLKALLSDSGYTRAAERFAKKYHADWLADHTLAMLDDIDRIG